MVLTARAASLRSAARPAAQRQVVRARHLLSSPSVVAGVRRRRRLAVTPDLPTHRHGRRPRREPHGGLGRLWTGRGGRRGATEQQRGDREVPDPGDDPRPRAHLKQHLCTAPHDSPRFFAAGPWRVRSTCCRVGVEHGPGDFNTAPDDLTGRPRRAAVAPVLRAAGQSVSPLAADARVPAVRLARARRRRRPGHRRTSRSRCRARSPRCAARRGRCSGSRTTERKTASRKGERHPRRRRGCAGDHRGCVGDHRGCAGAGRL
ncbi:uncharacterized protein SOCEGT47_033450 [Sorangium cellulosum]|uniref:Uncharacterized protein n=1 Tax=Sorangium cellulosum TaxID=56 RepID=A0A4V0NDI9_SORCE|nr:uncharacterized protein SOCEGT47_033450 [Sorangium cellulosum]